MKCYVADISELECRYVVACLRWRRVGRLTQPTRKLTSY